MLVACGALVLGLAGCGDKTIDGDEVEDFIREGARVPQVIESVECPDERDVEEGDTFECKIVAEDGSEEAVTVRQEDDDGTVAIVGNRQTRLPDDRKNLEILPENVESLIRGAAKDPEAILSVDCPSGVKVKENDRFRCVVRYRDRTEEVVEILQRDALGNVEIAGSRKRDGG